MSKKPPKGKSLAEVNPELAKQWHPTKNGDLTPFDITELQHLESILAMLLSELA